LVAEEGGLVIFLADRDRYFLC